MTFGQYKRLLLVLAVPLILAGATYAELIRPYPRNFVLLLCQKSSNEDWCRAFGSLDDNLYTQVQGQSAAWFDVVDAPASKPSITFIASADVRVLNGQIISAVPHAPNPASAAGEMNLLVGKNADIILGMQRGDRSTTIGDSVLLRCNAVQYLPDGKFASRCYGENWDGIVTYAATNDSAAMLQRLRDGVRTSIAAVEEDRLIYRMVGYSMFLAAFLLVSGIVWLLRRAYRYVKAG